MECREACGACCIIPSISSAIPGMPEGKPAGVRCIHLTEDLRCAVFKSPDRPAVCHQFLADPEICGHSRKQAIDIMSALENLSLKKENIIL